jgi:hypothetical protein
MTRNTKRLASGGEKRQRPKQTAFVAAATPSVARSLQKSLESAGFSSITTYECDKPGKSIPEITTECMRQSEIVIAVLGTGGVGANVFFELGLAHGLGKRILVIAEENAVLTARSLGDPYILAKPDDAEAVGAAVKDILALPHHGERPLEAPEKQSRPIGDLAEELLADLRPLDKNASEQKYVDVVRRAIEASGVTAITEAKLGDAHVDLAVWSDDLEPWVQNPLLIDVKINIPTKGQVKALADQMLWHLEKGRLSNALVIYVSAAHLAKQETHFPQVLFVSIQEFLESLRDSGFGDVVRRLRTRGLHEAT